MPKNTTPRGEKKSGAPAKPESAPRSSKERGTGKTRRPKAVAAGSSLAPTSTPNDNVYEVVLRTRKMKIKAMVIDRVLYPQALAWNRLLTADLGRRGDREAERNAWRAKGREAIVELAKSGLVDEKDVDAFITSAAECGEVQIEMNWEREALGWAARIFPWEALISLATKGEREISEKGLVVVRYLRNAATTKPVSDGPYCFAVSKCAKDAGFDTTPERAAIASALERSGVALRDLAADTPAQLSAEVRKAQPKVLHYVQASRTEEIETPSPDTFRKRRPQPRARQEETSEEVIEVVRRVASHRPQLVVFSTCYSGRRYAPLALTEGAGLAMGFHGHVTEQNIPPFWSGFYVEWAQSGDVILALKKGLETNSYQNNPGDLGVVTVWSSTDLLSATATRRAAAGASTPPNAAALESAANGATAANSSIFKSLPTPVAILNVIPPERAAQALVFSCTLEKALNYSMLHNQRGGIVSRFDVLKVQPGILEDLEVSVRIATGVDRPVECHFFASLPQEEGRSLDFVDKVILPLGSELFRRRGEMLRGTVEIIIKCGAVRVFHSFGSIELPPCDEWKDDSTGASLLPSFIFPRDPAVREILSAAQPFLRAIADQTNAAFGGYQGDISDDSAESNSPARSQLRAIWGALQLARRIDYSNPPPSYANRVQRIRTPEEVMRSSRGTCIELALLLAACWEHIGVFPVIFLTRGHAFVGYWADDSHWEQFFAPAQLVDGANAMEDDDGRAPDEMLEAARDLNISKVSGSGKTRREPGWVLNAPHHLKMIFKAINARQLVPVEATCVALQESFSAAEKQGKDLVLAAFAEKTFDAMIDIQTARNLGVTPLAIVTQGVVA